MNTEAIPEVKVQQTLVEHIDVPERIIDYTSDTPLPRPLAGAPSDGRTHDIIDFLKRPVVVATGAWSSGDADSSRLTSINLPNDFLVHPMIANKVGGFKFFRGTAKVTLMVNANRFQAGRLCMTFYPNHLSNLTRYYNQIIDRASFTALPRVDFDAATDTQVSFNIPYHTNFITFNMQNHTGNQGALDLFVYSALNVVAGDDTAEYTILVSYDDVKLEFPVYYPAYVQALTVTSRRTKKDTSQVEEDAYGPLTGILSGINTSARHAMRVPFLSTVAGPLEWVSNALKHTALHFGLSKPIMIKEFVQTIPRPFYRVCNSFGFDGSFNLGVHEDNRINIIPGLGGEAEDEMSFQYMFSRQTLIGAFTFPETSPSGTVIATVNVQPIGFIANIGNISVTDPGGTTAVPTVTMPPFVYIASMFRYWRGSINFHFKIVKTEFHSGRLLFTFNPDPTTAASTFDQANFVYREIVDLRYTNEFTMKVPYVSASPWSFYEASIGNVSVIVQNELRSPPTVASNIVILIECSAGEDFQVAWPKQPTWFPVILTTTPPAFAINAVDTGISLAGNLDPIQEIPADKLIEYPSASQIKDATVQAGDSTAIDTQSQHVQESKPSGDLIGTSSNVPDTLMSAASCIGESIDSFRALLKRFIPFYSTIDATFFNSAPNIPVFVVPWYRSYLYNGVSVQQTNDPSDYLKPDYYSMVAPLYNFGRGSMRLKIIKLTNSANSSPIRTTISSSALAFINYPWKFTLIPDPASIIYPTISVPVNPQISLGVEVQVPYYNNTFNTPLTYVRRDGVTVWPDSIQPVIGLQTSDANLMNSIQMQRALGDDFSLSYFVGIPPCISGTSMYNYVRLGPSW